MKTILRFLFAYKNGDFGAMSVMSEAAMPICIKTYVESHISDI